MAVAAIAMGLAINGTPAYADDVADAQVVVDEATVARDDVIARIDDLETQIDEANASIPAAREQLRVCVRSTYKYQQELGHLGILSVILDCQSLDEVITALRAQDALADMNARSVRQLEESYDRLESSRADLDEELAQAELTLEEANEELAARKEEAAERERQAAQARSTVSSGTPAYENSGSGLTKWGGVYYYNGHRETYYSSRVLRHYRIGEWHTDSEGFWRTAEGYYVVAANSGEYAQGTLVDTSKGLAQVLDSGCAYGTIDMYVNW